MAIASLLASLSARATVALPYIQSMVASGLGAEAIINALGTIRQGLTFRRTDMLSLIRAVKNVEASGDYLKSVRNDLRPDPSRLPRPVGTTLRRYSFKAAIHGIDEETGERVTKHLTLSMSELLSINEMKEAALAVAEAGASIGSTSMGGEGFIPESAVILTGTKAF